MSVYVTIIETAANNPTSAINEAVGFIKGAEIIRTPEHNRRFWIGTSSDPMQTRASFARVYPFAPYLVIHAIRADNRADMLNEALRMKLSAQHIAHGWYKLSSDDLTWLRSITTDNYAQVVPQIENEIARLAGIEVRDVTKGKMKRCAGVIIADEATEMTTEQIEAMKQALLDRIASGQ